MKRDDLINELKQFSPDQDIEILIKVSDESGPSNCTLEVFEIERRIKINGVEYLSSGIHQDVNQREEKINETR